MRGRARMPGLRHVASAVVLCILAGLPAFAQDRPSLKEILGRAQSEAERKAVEDLIGKLQGKGAAHKQPIAQPHPEKKEPDQAAATEKANETPVAADQPPPSEQPSQASAGGKTSLDVQPPVDQQAAAKQDEPTPETPKVAAKSTSEPAELAVEKAERRELPSVDLEVLFEFDSANLTPAAMEILTTLGRALLDERLAGAAFLIGGHTDAKGRAEYNRDLSHRRAEAVRQFLIATFGIDAARLTAKGFGERYLKNPRQPRAPENRRVQIVNLSQQEAR